MVSLVAWGGVGKSTLVNKWLEHMAADNYRGARRVFAWSFYSQGTNQPATSADLFIAEALKWFGDADPAQGSPWDKGGRLAHNRVWMKAEAELPPDPVVHAAALVYSSDTTVLDSIITTHGLSWGFDRIFAVTMNHSVWFHRQIRFDDWVLYSTSSPVAADSRGLGTGHFFDPAGRVVASVVQEGIVKHFPSTPR